MNRDEEIAKGPSRSPANDEVDSEPKVAPESHENVRRPESPTRPRTGADAWQPPTAPLAPFKVAAGALNRNIPTHPSWEKPPSPYNYPRLRGQEKRQSMKPLLFAAIGVALILGAVVALPALLSRKGSAAVATGSSSPGAIVSSQPLQTATPYQSVNSGGTPVPLASYQQYQVRAGDSVTKIAAKFHLQRWELLLANPQLTGPAYAVLVNTYLNIPVPGTLTPPPTTPTVSPTVSSGATLVAP